MTISRLPWARIFGESALIIVSIYLAIFLEGVSQDRASNSSAHLKLVQIRAAGELTELESPGLVSRLGNFCESLNARVVDNGDDYDESVNDILEYLVSRLVRRLSADT